MPQKVTWRTATRNGQTIRYAVVTRDGQRVVLIKK